MPRRSAGPAIDGGWPARGRRRPPGFWPLVLSAVNVRLQRASGGSRHRAGRQLDDSLGAVAKDERIALRYSGTKAPHVGRDRVGVDKHPERTIRPVAGYSRRACTRWTITVSAGFRLAFVGGDIESRSRRGHDGRHLEVAMMAQGYVACHGLEAASRGASPHRHDRLGGGGGMGIAQSTPARQLRLLAMSAPGRMRRGKHRDVASELRLRALPCQGPNGATDPRRPIAGGCRWRGRDRW